MKTSLPDGLYRVCVPKVLCAGFVVEGGRVTECAPILRRRLAYWFTQAVRIADANPPTGLLAGLGPTTPVHGD